MFGTRQRNATVSPVSPFVINAAEFQEYNTNKNNKIGSKNVMKTAIVGDSKTLVLCRIQAFWKDLHWLLFSMKVFGIFIEHGTEASTEDIYANKPNQFFSGEIKNNKCIAGDEGFTSACRCKRFARIYSTCILIMFWLQSLRMLSTFNREDKTVLIIISKLTVVVFTFMSTLMFTSYYIASLHGTLLKTFQEIPRIADCPIPIRKRVIVFTICAWTYTLAGTMFLAYMTFFTNQNYNEFLIAPFGSLISNINDHTMITFKFIYVLTNFLMNANFTMTTAATTTITSSLIYLFRQVHDRVKASINVDGRFEGNLEGYHQQHQRIARIVNKTDQFLHLYMGTTVVCNIAMIVKVLFFMISAPFLTPEIIFMMSIWISNTVSHLIITALGAVKLNNAVSMKI